MVEVLEPTKAEQVEQEMQEISAKYIKYFLQFIALASTTAEYIQFTKEPMLRLKELNYEKQAAIAPNRQTRARIEKQKKLDTKKLNHMIQNSEKFLRSLSDYMLDEEEFKDFVDESVDKIGEVLDGLELNR